MSTLGTRVYIGPRPRWFFGMFRRNWRVEPLAQVTLLEICRRQRSIIDRLFLDEEIPFPKGEP